MKTEIERYVSDDAWAVGSAILKHEIRDRKESQAPQARAFASDSVPLPCAILLFAREEEEI